MHFHRKVDRAGFGAWHRSTRRHRFQEDRWRRCARVPVRPAPLARL